MEIAAASPQSAQAGGANYASVLAQKAIQQITEPVPPHLQQPAAAVSAGAVATGAVQQSPAQAAMSPIIQQQLMPSVAAPATAEPVNFVQEIQSMLYSFGDSRRPRLETAILVDDIVRQQLVEIVYRATEASVARGANGVVGIEDILFLLRKSPVKVQRFVKYFKIKDMSSQAVAIQQNVITDANKRAKRCRDFLVSIDVEGGLLTQAINDELVDEVRMNRLRRRDRFTRHLDEKRYAEFTRARHISFIGHNMRFAAKFREWVTNGIKAVAVDDPSVVASSGSAEIKMDSTGLEALAYLAYETVGSITEMALAARHDADPAKKTDPVQMALYPVAFNTQYPMVQVGTAAAFCLLIGRTPVVAAQAQLTGDDLDVNHLKDQDDQAEKKKDVVKEVKVKCNSEDITVSVGILGENAFNGMIYPKGLSKNSTCMTEYIQAEGSVDYVIPLRSCNTMSTDVVDGLEYFNTIVVQPHRKLVTNQGRGYHIRCRYQTKEKTLLSNFNVSGGLANYPLYATAAMPGTSMRIYYGEPIEGAIAESVKIGDPLTLVVSIDDQDIYGMHINECLVRDGVGWSEQRLINDEGCPVDSEIMGQFEYSATKTTALVRFQAHKFPYTSSVYYQCNIRLCIKHAGGCDNVPPICDEEGFNTLLNRKKRQTLELDETKGPLYDTDREDLKVKVYSGLYVNEAEDLDDSFLDSDIAQEISSKAYDPSTICIPQRDFAIGIAIAGLLLIVAVIAAILILLTKRRRRKDLSTTGSSIYSGPYTNTAYSYSS